MEIRQQTGSRAQSESRKHQLFLLTKRVIDIVLSLTGICIFAPLFIVISYIILRNEGKPLLSRELKVGRERRLFMLRTFRTMTNPSRVIRALPPHPFPDSWSNGVPDAFHFRRHSQQTFTQTGKWIKKYHLDCLPMLINILKGDMSLVGPNPEIPEITAYYNRYQEQRLTVRPGMTGPAQMNGYSNQTHGKKVTSDIDYIKNCSIKYDIYILSRAVRQIFGNFNRKRLR